MCFLCVRHDVRNIMVVIYFSLHLILSLIFQTRIRGWSACSIAELVSGKPEKNHLPPNPQPLIVVHILNPRPSHGVEFLSTGWNTPSCICSTPATVWVFFWFFQTHFGAHSTKLSWYLGDLGPIGVFNMSQPLSAILGTESRALCLLVKWFPTELKPSPPCQLMI